MKLRVLAFVIALLVLAPSLPAQSSIDRDLIEVTIPRLEHFYATRAYSVTQVVQWYIARIRRYNPVYGPVEFLNSRQALAQAAKLDAEAAANPNLARGPLWGVPIVIKENTSVQDLVTTDGCKTPRRGSRAALS